jgi:PAS domain S-box-containing protein
MTATLRALLIEDSELDAALVVRQLEKAQLALEWERVEDGDALRLALQKPWDVIISDNHLPQFDAAAALQLVRDAGSDVPFIVVSGSIGEEAAVALMKSGAQDYLRKDNLARLAAVVEREIFEARERERLRSFRIALHESEERFRTVVEKAPDAIFIQTGGEFAYVNAAAIRLFGAQSAEELLGRRVPELFRPDFREQVLARMRRLNERHETVEAVEEIGLRLDGSEVHVEVSAVPFFFRKQDGALVFARDISARKRTEAALAEQLEELRRWYTATIGRESRVLELKEEINRLLADRGDAPRYPSAGQEEEPQR